MTSQRNQIRRTAAVDNRVATRFANRALRQPGPQDPRLIKPGYPNSPSRPRGKATVDRRQLGKARRSKATSTSGVFLRTSSSVRRSSPEPSLSASSLSSKRTRTEPTIFPIQLLSCGGHERCTPLKSKEDSANAVGIAPMALPLDLAMEVWDSWPTAVGLTGHLDARVRAPSCTPWLVAACGVG
jgi:hypothetical protein